MLTLMEHSYTVNLKCLVSTYQQARHIEPKNLVMLHAEVFTLKALVVISDNVPLT